MWLSVVCILIDNDTGHHSRQDLLTIENTDSDLKVHALYYANELLVRVSFPVKNFCKLAQHAEAIRSKKKTLFGKRVMKRTDCR